MNSPDTRPPPPSPSPAAFAVALSEELHLASTLAQGHEGEEASFLIAQSGPYGRRIVVGAASFSLTYDRDFSVIDLLAASQTPAEISHLSSELSSLCLHSSA